MHELKPKWRLAIFLAAILSIILAMCGGANCTPRAFNEIDDCLTDYSIPVDRAIHVTKLHGILLNEGSAFLVRHNNKVYFVSAYHVVNPSLLRKHASKDILFKLGGRYILDTPKWKLSKTHDYFIVEAIEYPDDQHIYDLGIILPHDDYIQHTVCVGYPLGEYGAKSGCVQTVTQDVIITTCKVELGMSGGPLLDHNGDVIGITTAKRVDENGNTLFGVHTNLISLFE